MRVGTRAVKRTALPLLYNLDEDVSGLNVIDFPGVDDQEHTVPEVVRHLLSLAQIVVFVVDYRLVINLFDVRDCPILTRNVFIYCFWPLLFRKASSDPVKWWLQQLTKNDVPVLVCLTYADVLYLECKEADRQEDIASELEV